MDTMDEIIARKMELRNEFIAEKVDLEKIITKSLRLESAFNCCLWEQMGNEASLEVHPIALFLRESRPSLVGPGYALNGYIDAYVEDVFWDEIKNELDEDKWVSSSLRRMKIIIEMQNCLIAIKSGLDRFVRLFSIYYRGVSPHSTFGHIDENGKTKGFMSYVMSNKDNNSVFAFIAEEYSEWIQKCVLPRDAIIHYKDFGELFAFDDTFSLHPIGINEKNGKAVNMDILTLINYVKRYYSFHQHVIMEFCNKERMTCNKEVHCERCLMEAANEN